DGYLAAETLDVELWPRLEPTAREQRGAGLAEARSAKAGPTREKNDEPLTFAQTATRAFELRYWKTIADLPEGRYLNKNSGDCVRDAATQARLPHPRADLDPLAEY